MKKPNKKKLIESLNVDFVSGNHVTLLKDGPETYEAMLKAVKAAEKCILLESYIFEDDGFGEKLCDVLIEKKNQGCVVVIIYDSAGSFSTTTDHFQEMADAGIGICEFNPIAVSRWHKLLHLHHRDHRKILVIDDQIAFTGGINISKVYSASSSPHIKRKKKDLTQSWRDTHVKIEGPAARLFVELIKATLERQKCDDLVIPNICEANPAERGEMQVAVVDSVGHERKNEIHHAMLCTLRAASESIMITNAYFCPGKPIVRAIKAAARRGVDVHLLLPEESDWKLLKYAGQSHFSGLLRAGVKIHLYEDGMLHAKTILVDGIWATVGSSNMDYRSLAYNDEANAIILSEKFAGEMQEMFDQDIQQARQIDRKEWRHRRIRDRFFEAGARLCERWL